jgi:hypothetical protein
MTPKKLKSLRSLEKKDQLINVHVGT